MIHRFLGKALLAASVLAAMGGAAGAQVRERTLKFAFQNPADHPQAQGAQRFAELVARKSNGRIHIDLYPAGALGDDLQTVSALQGGTVDLTVLNAGTLSAKIKEFAVFDFPFLFDSVQEADAVTDGPFGQKMFARLEEKGMHGLAYWDLGFRNLTNNKRPVARTDDIVGLRIRVAQSPIYIDLLKAWGAKATPIPFSEVLPALEQKAVDGQETPNTVTLSSRFAEVQKYITQTRHVYSAQTLLVSSRTWDGMSADERKIFADAATEATKYQRRLSRSAADTALDALRRSGMAVTEMPPAEVARLREKTRPVVDKYAATVGEATMKELMAEIAKAHARMQRTAP